MSNTNYSEYRNFFETLIEGYNAQEQLPIRIGGYNVTESELPGEVIRSTIEYLTEKNCPKVLIPPIIDKVMENIKNDEVTLNNAKSQDDQVYSPLKLMQMIVTNIFSICQCALQNDVLEKILPSSTWPKNDPPICAISSIKNSRRAMEDRYICIDDFDGIHKTKVDEKTSFYGVFDGHAGATASAYTASQLHRLLASSPNYATNPLEALKDAFRTTDINFIDKCNKEKLTSGTTALCVLYRPITPCLFVGWVGDSQALLVRKGKVFQIVSPHKPNLESERKRIHDQGGWVIKWNGSWRVNGSLAVARAIGDAEYKPYVTGEPDVRHIPLDGEEDFLVLACDGLWDYATEDDVAINVYRQVREDPENLDLVTQRLVRLSKTQGSTDNITIIVVFLKDPHIIATSSWPSESIPFLSENMDTAYDANNQESQKNLFDMDYEIKSTTGEFTGKLLPSDIDNENYNNGNATNLLDYTDVLNNASQIITPTTTDILTTNASSTNGKRSADDLISEEYEEDLGPETDVDALDEIMMSPKEIKEEQQMECKDVDEIETTKIITDHFDETANKLIDETDKKFELNNDLLGNIIVSGDGTNPFEDNKIRDLFDDDDEVDEMKVTSELVDRVTNELLLTRDVSIEKQDQSFEKDDIDDIIAPAADDIIQETIISPVLESSATAEHHAVAESGGEDSEDEWNYFKGDKKSITTTKTETIEEDEQKERQEEIEETHALSQAIAESQEICSDLIQSVQDDGLEQELIDIEINSQRGLPKEHHQQQAELESLKEEQNEDLNQDDDEMSSQLNPDAKEFVPTSPVRSTNQSPFNLLNQNGTNPTLNPHQPAYLFEDDNIIAQSPRKGTPMDDITLPAENDFDIEISRRPAELEAQNGDAVNVERPGSSSSQASYQEMNLKEAMHGDEKLEYAPEVDDLIEQAKENVDAVVGQLSAKVLSESDPMNMSFYQDNEHDIINPFDLNTVQRLPVDDDFEAEIISTENTQKIMFEGEQGQRFVIEDNDFGMQDNLVSHDEISKPEDDMYSPVSENKIIEETVASNLESDKPESELLLHNDKTNDLLEQVTEDASKITVSETHSDIENRFQSESCDVAAEQNEELKSHLENGHSIIASPIESHPEVIPQETEEQAESESSFLQKSDDVLTDQSSHVSENPNEFECNTQESEIVAEEKHEISHDMLVDESVSAVEKESPVEPYHIDELVNAGTPPPTPAILDFEAQQRIATPEPQHIVEAVEKLSIKPLESPEHVDLVSPVESVATSQYVPIIESEVIASVNAEKPVEPANEELKPTEPELAAEESKNIEVAAAAAVAATTLAATAAIAASIASTENEKVKATEPAKTTKSTSKTGTPSKTTPKTTIAPIKKTTATGASTAKLTATAKPSSAPSKAAPKPLTSAPVKSSTVNATKTATKPTVTLTKKPLTNGEAKATSSIIKKTTTTTTKTGDSIAKTSAGSIRSTTTTTTTRTSLSSAPRAATSTLTKTTASKTAATPRAATATKAAPSATKPPTSTTSKPTRPVSSTTSASSAATKTSTTRTPISPAKTKPATSTITDKQSKDTTNKLRTATSTLNTSKTATATSRTTNSAATKKVTDVKSPITAKSRTITATGGSSTVTTTTTSTTAKSSTVGGTRKPTTTTRTSITKKTTAASPISKPGNNDSKTTKLTTVKVEKQLFNGDLISEKEVINTTILDSNGDVLLNEDNENIIKKDGSSDHQMSPTLIDNSQMIVIDSAAD